MNISARKLIDIRGRLWIRYDQKLVLYDDLPPLREGEYMSWRVSEGDNPVFSHDYQFRLANNIDSFLPTEDGRIYNCFEGKFLEIPHVIRYFHYSARVSNNHAITNENLLISITTNEEGDVTAVRIIAENIAHLLDVKSTDERRQFLVITCNGEWKKLNAEGENIQRNLRAGHLPLPHPDSIVKVKKGFVITTNGYVRIDRTDEGWDINFFRASGIKDAIDVQHALDSVKDFNHTIILDNQGQLSIRSVDYSEGQIVDCECENRDLIEHNAQHQWTQLVNLFDDVYTFGLVNKIGEVYKVNYDFMSTTTNIPTEIYALPPTNTKNARNAR